MGHYENILKISSFCSGKYSFIKKSLFLAEKQVDNGSVQVPVLANLVVEVALVRILDPLRQVAEEDEGGHMGTLEHGDVLDLDILALDSGGAGRPGWLPASRC